MSDKINADRFKSCLVELFLNSKMPFISQFSNFAGDIAHAKFTSDRELVHEMLRTGRLPKNIPGMLKISRVLGFPYKGRPRIKSVEKHLLTLPLTNFPHRRLYLKEIHKKKFKNLIVAAAENI